MNVLKEVQAGRQSFFESFQQINNLTNYCNASH